jgi:hypothetical protein
MLGIAPDSPASGARFVRRFFFAQDSLPEKRLHSHYNKIFHNFVESQIASSVDCWTVKKIGL